MPKLTLIYPYWYGYIKALHIISVVTWFAGLFYLPRLFVYHSMTNNEVSANQFKTMQHKLFWYIMTPSAVFAITFGEILAHVFGFSGLWLHLKTFLVGTLVVYHIYCFKLMEDFAKDCNTKSTRWLRIFNEYPSLVLISCVLLVVIKPHF